MEKINGPELRNKILSILRSKGPSLPIHIARETGLSVLFASAFLSELSSDKEVKISSMKVGGSPVYFVPGHEEQLEKYSNYLPGKEREALFLLKEKRLLEDVMLEPAIRVALRSIKDFAFPVVLNEDGKQRVFWRHLTFLEKEAQELVLKDFVKKVEREEIRKEIVVEVPKIEIKKEEVKPEIKIAEEAKPEILIKETQTKKKVEKPIIELKPEKIKKEKIKEKSDFARKIGEFFVKEDIEVIEEKEWSKKDFYAIIRINSNIGKLRFYAVCKDKKKITEDELAVALHRAQALKMPVYFVSTGSLDKKAEKYLQEYNGLIGFRRV